MNDRIASIPVPAVDRPVGSSDMMEATLQMERAVAHHLAHDLNNALGAIEVFSEMLIEDVTDPKIQGQLDKMRRAALMARVHVDVLRQTIPKHLSGTGHTSLSTAITLVQKMLGDQASRFVLRDFDDMTLAGDASVITYILYQLAAHMLGSSGAPVKLDISHEKGGGMITLALKTSGAVNPLSWEIPFFMDVLNIFGASMHQNAGALPEAGFSLHWPCAAL